MEDVDEAIASLARLRAWAERIRRAGAGDAEFESTIQNAERVHQQIIMQRAEDVESANKKQ